jgi:cytochrome c-type biogenesis protein CcmH/NrfG
LVVAPASAEGHYLLGRAALEDGDDATALEQLAIAGRLSPGSPEVHFNLAKAYDRANQPAKAEQERQTFARLNAATENQRSHQGPQIYSGPHNAGALAQPSRQSSSDSGSSEQPPKR